MNTETFPPNQEYPVWGLTGTLIWSFIIAVLYVITQTFAIGVYIGINYGDVAPAEFEQLMTNIQQDGAVLSICTIVSLLVCGPLILGIIKLKKNSSIKHYLGLRLVSARDLIFWFVTFCGLIVLSDLLTLLLGKPIVPEYMTSVYASATSTWMFLLALVVAAPILEEMFFRGFIISGISSTFVGPIGAIIISTLSWTAIHIQYDLYGMATIFVMGLVLGVARIKTGSILLTIGLHAFSNLIATIETAISLAQNS